MILCGFGIIYKRETLGPQDIPFPGVEAINARLPENRTALDYLRLYFTDTVINLIVTETYRYAQQYLEREGQNLRKHSILQHWVPTNYDEMCALLGLLMLMGIVHKPRVAVYRSHDELFSSPIFKNIMTRDRYLSLVKFLHFADNTNYDANDPD